MNTGKKDDTHLRTLIMPCHVCGKDDKHLIVDSKPVIEPAWAPEDAVDYIAECENGHNFEVSEFDVID